MEALDQVADCYQQLRSILTQCPSAPAKQLRQHSISLMTSLLTWLSSSSSPPTANFSSSGKQNKTDTNNNNAILGLLLSGQCISFGHFSRGPRTLLESRSKVQEAGVGAKAVAQIYGSSLNLGRLVSIVPNADMLCGSSSHDIPCSERLIFSITLQFCNAGMTQAAKVDPLVLIQLFSFRQSSVSAGRLLTMAATSRVSSSHRPQCISNGRLSRWHCHIAPVS